MGRLTFNDVERELRWNNFGTLSTIDADGRPSSVGLLYAISTPRSPFRVYVMSQARTRKVRNIKANPNVSFVVPCRRRLLWVVPPNCIQFQGIAEVLAADDAAGRSAFEGSYLMRMMLKKASQVDTGALGEPCFICIRPNPVIHTYGLGLSAWQLYMHIEEAGSRVKVPANRLQGHPESSGG